MERACDATEVSIGAAQTSESDSFEEPQGELECAIARLWREVFRLERIGRSDNFFELGGDSLVGMKLTEAFATSLELQLPVVVIFQNPTIRELAGLIAPLSSTG